MEEKRDIRAFYGRPVMMPRRFAWVYSMMMAPLVIGLGIMLPWVGFGAAIVMKDDDCKLASMLKLASFIGIILWVSGAVVMLVVYNEMRIQ